MLKLIGRSFVVTLLLAVLLCGAYPLAVTLLGKAFFADPSGGGIVIVDGKPVGARLIGQAFTRPEYFHGRPSAAGAAPSAPSGYDAANSSGSNLGPTNQKFIDGLRANVDKALAENPGLRRGEVPTDLVTASGSGLDPHISPGAARVQVARVAQARGMPAEELARIVESQVEHRSWGLFGDPVVNVLALNLELDRQHPVKK